MNHAVVVDASVAIKWIVAEEFADQAEALLIDHASLPIVCPPPLASEVTNALYQRTHRSDPATHLTIDEAHDALVRFLAVGVELVSPPDLYERAFAFARTHRLPNVYDSLSIALAQVLEVDLWTDDRELLAAIGPAAPWVRWIRDYPVASNA
jgi:predicted nucleic acid-binding protein